MSVQAELSLRQKATQAAIRIVTLVEKGDIRVCGVEAEIASVARRYHEEAAQPLRARIDQLTDEIENLRSKNETLVREVDRTHQVRRSLFGRLFDTARIA